MNGVTQLLTDSIRKGFEQMAEAEYEKAKDQLIKNLDAKRSEYVAGVVIDLMRTVNFQRMGEDLVITVNQKGIK